MSESAFSYVELERRQRELFCALQSALLRPLADAQGIADDSQQLHRHRNGYQPYGEMSYSAPKSQLPRNHAMPKPVSKMPKPVLRMERGMTRPQAATYPFSGISASPGIVSTCIA